MAHRGAWDDVTVAKLKKLAATGEYSASQIGRMLGVNRSQVLGKCHRLKISIVGVGPRRKIVRQHTMKRVHIEPLPMLRADDVARKRLADLADNECKFPVGHPGEKGFGFCAAERVQGLPYCARHAARCYTAKPVKTNSKDMSQDASAPVRNASDLVSAGE